MNFMEAVKLMQKGYKVSRNNKVYGLSEYFLGCNGRYIEDYSTDERFVAHLVDIDYEATDWEMVGEEI